MGKNTGTVFDIMKFAIHDGPGIRTTVFLKGCPLKCLWCHNPESQQREKEISFLADNCIGCGYCFEHCPRDGHQMQGDKHVMLRQHCIRCGACAEQCYAKAIEVVGREMAVDEVLDVVLEDKAFYESSDGGMTVSGGEPMMQPEFTAALLRAARAAGLHTCVDTCGYTAFANYQKVLDVVDLFLYDIKDTDPERHKENTGVPLEPILKNLRRLDAAGARIILRCPVIPGINADDEHLKAVAALADSLSNVTEVTLHPYHPLGSSKSERFGGAYPLPDISSAEDADVERCLEVVSAHTKVPARRN